MENLTKNYIEVQGYKHDGRMHRIRDRVYVVEEKENYIVVCSTKTKVVEHNFRVWYTKEPAVMIFFKDKWMNVIAMFKKSGITYYVNLASPYIKDKGYIKYIDYDLDMKLYPNQNIRIIDVKEYAYHREKYQYGEDIDTILKYNINKVKEMMKNREFPFIDEKIVEFYEKYKKEEGEMNAKNNNQNKK